jgi:hypothetical protein
MRINYIDPYEIISGIKQISKTLLLLFVPALIVAFLAVQGKFSPVATIM